MASVAEKEEKKVPALNDAVPANELEAEPRKKPNRKIFIFGLIGMLAVAAVVFGVRFVVWSSSHVSTDDATIALDVVQIAPQITGTVTSVKIRENQHVKKGDLLVELDASSFQTAVDQAKANLDLAIAQAKGASETVELTQRNTQAQVLQAEGVVGQSNSGIRGSLADTAKAKSQVAQTRAQASSAEANVYGAQAQLQIALANKIKAYDAVSSAEAQLDTSLAAVKTAQSNVDAAQATAINANKQAARTETLFKQGAASGEVADQARAAADVAKAQVAAAQQQVVQAETVVSQRRSDLLSAKSQLPAADAAVSQARAMVTAAKDQVTAARQAVEQSQAQVNYAQASISQARAKNMQAKGQFNQANTGPEQVAVSQSQNLQAEAKVEQARAALRDAQINLDRTRIVAPMDGRISKNTVEVGNLVQPGESLMAIVPDEDPWVVANFKETQLADVRANEPVEIDVDGLPGKSFKGYVQSISAGTGSTFALLPPDNATGNFTKVVQRITVKIYFNHGQPDLDKLRTGMSVTATITTKP